MGTNRERGFTLVELMVVIVLIGLLAGVVGVKVIPLIFKGQRTTAEAQIKEIKGNLDLYYMEYSRYPETLEELTQPTETRDSFMEEIPLDQSAPAPRPFRRCSLRWCLWRSVPE